MNSTNQNNFGNLSKHYDDARKGYPVEVFNYLINFSKNKTRLTLDIGCGTGISTRELKQYGFNATGVDIDDKMIEVAKSYDGTIKYYIAPADRMPFDAESFDIVTAFTAFHWFEDEKSVCEILRVLKSGGIFFSALKRTRKDVDSNPQYEPYKQILKKYAGDSFDSTRKYNPKDLLYNCGFNNIKEKSFYFEEQYRIDEALTLIQSISFWNLVSEDDKAKMLEELKGFYESIAVDGVLTKYREVLTIVAIK